MEQCNLARVSQQNPHNSYSHTSPVAFRCGSPMKIAFRSVKYMFFVFYVMKLAFYGLTLNTTVLGSLKVAQFLETLVWKRFSGKIVFRG